MSSYRIDQASSFLSKLIISNNQIVNIFYDRINLYLKMFMNVQICSVVRYIKMLSRRHVVKLVAKNTVIGVFLLIFWDYL